MCFLLMQLASEGNTQTLNPDTVCLPIREAQRVLKSAKDGKIFRAERDTARKLIVLMGKRIYSKDSTIESMSTTITGYQQLVENYEKENSNLVDQRDSHERDALYFQGLYKKETKKVKAWKWGTGIGIVLTIAGMIFK
jgi:hypothetical protein